jgi:non-ribosomal peptide synthase protein (TIGR01720 family)
VTANELTASELRGYLAQELPEYMIPSHFVRLERLPLNPNGKIDRDALPEPEGNLPTGVEYEAPRTEVEAKLVAIWQSVLGPGTIGIHDRFFDLGGDSIKAIQVAARLQNQGYKLEFKDIFQHSTIGELSGYVTPLVSRADQGAVLGHVGLTPIQHWFFEHRFEDKHHFNQSVMLYRKAGFDQRKLRCAFDRLVAHHDALRMTYQNEAPNIIQYNRGLEGEFYQVQVFDFSNDSEYRTKVESVANRLQREFNLSEGPLVKLGLFKTGEGDHLLLIIHHLVIDGVSWRILLEDLATGYQNDPTPLPLKTHSFREWSARLKEYGNSREFLNEKEYWINMERQNVAALPKRAPHVEEAEGRQNISFKLSPAATEKLLHQVHSAYNTQINDSLLVALGRAIRQTTGQDRVLLELEGHGREEILPGINVGRTVGWFTAIFPVLLDLSGSDEWDYHIKHTKENLRRIPNHGVGYGILKYLTNPEHKQELTCKLQPEISFNYLGQFDHDIATELFSLSPLAMGRQITTNYDKVRKPLDISGIVINGELIMSFDFDTNIYHPEMISALLENYQTALLDVIEYCVGKMTVELTPSDFEANDLSVAELEKILNRVNSL